MPSQFYNAFKSSMQVSGAAVYEECRHGWRVKLRDWIRLRRHPSDHLLWVGPVDPEGGFDLNADTIQVSFTSDGTATFHLD